MRLSIQRLRWVLIAGAFLLVGVLAVYIGYGRYQALKAYRQIIARSGVSLTHDSNGVTYSQSIKGKKVFTLRAKTESSLGNGKYALHDAELLLYNRDGVAADHIYGSEMEYDQNEQVARAKGEVFMDIQPPQGLANGGRSKTQTAKARPASAPVIHVRTSGLVYVRKLGIAATEQEVEFNYGDMTCTALGAEFNTNENTVKLLANVHMDGLAHGKPLHVTAARADMSRDENIANLTAPVVTSDDRRMRADMAVITLRHDGSIEGVQGNNHVVLTGKTQQITANRLDASLSAQSIPQTAKLTGDVVMVDSNPLRPMHGSAAVVDVAMDAQGQPTKVVATGAAKLSMVDRKSNPSGFTRSMDGAKIIALFAPEQQHKSSARLTEIHAIGSAHASGQSLAAQSKGAISDGSRLPALKTVQVSADDLRTTFIQTADRRAHPEKLYGTGHTQLQQDAPLGEQEISSADTLEILFAPVHSAVGPSQAEAMSIASAVQTGNVVIHDRAAAKLGSTAPASITNGTAERASYDGQSQILTLTGAVHLDGENGSLVAPTVSLNQSTQDAEASGGVQATFQNTSSKTSNPAPNAKPEPLTHVLAASAHFDHATRFATFYGTDASPARMWQDASQVQAATLLFDGIKRTFGARPGTPDGLVYAILASNASPLKPGAPLHLPSMIRVASPKMDYNDLQREATFSDGVMIDDTTGEVHGQHAVAFLTPAHSPAATHPVPTSPSQPNPLNGSIDRVVVYGTVQIDQPGRHGTGEQLLYTASKANYILTGTPSNPAHITDTQQGNVTGATLIFGDAGSTIVVAGEQGVPKGKEGRVHTETYVHPGNKKKRGSNPMRTLETEELTKAYGGRQVVCGVSLEIRQGEVVGLLGPNGAGKTTSFYMIVGLIRPDSGRILTDGADITRTPMYLRAREHRISYLPQEPSVFRNLSVEENILAVLETQHLTWEARRKRTESLISQLNLGHVRKTRGYALSGGERRRVEIARCLAIEPAFILLDEPFSGIDPIAVLELQQIIFDLKASGIGVLITDHNVRETLSVTDRAYIINEGRIFRTGTPGELGRDLDVKRVYLGEGFSMV